MSKIDEIKDKPVILHKEGMAGLEEIRTLYNLNVPSNYITKENVDTVVMLLSNEIASSHVVFNKGNSQAAVHAVVLLRDLLLGDKT